MNSALHAMTAMHTSVLQASKTSKPTRLSSAHARMRRAIRGDVGDVLSPALQAAAMQGTARLYMAARDSLNRQLERFETFALETCLAVPPGLLTSVEVGPAEGGDCFLWLAPCAVQLSGVLDLAWLGNAQHATAFRCLRA